MPKKIIGLLLYVANSKPPTKFEEDFYDYKGRILDSIGRFRRTVVQRIQKYHGYQFTILREYDLDGFCFHKPIGGCFKQKSRWRGGRYPSMVGYLRGDIEGYVYHQNYPRWLRWLCYHSLKVFFCPDLRGTGSS